jgi:hypothetical protein
MNPRSSDGMRASAERHELAVDAGHALLRRNTCIHASLLDILFEQQAQTVPCAHEQIGQAHAFERDHRKFAVRFVGVRETQHADRLLCGDRREQRLQALELGLEQGALAFGTDTKKSSTNPASSRSSLPFHTGSVTTGHLSRTV